MDSTTKTRLAELSGEIIKAYHLGDTGKGAALAAEAIRLRVTNDLAHFANFVDQVADKMKRNPGQTFGLDDTAAVETYGSLALLDRAGAVNVLFHTVTQRAKEINEAKPIGGITAKVPARPVKDSPQA